MWPFPDARDLRVAALLVLAGCGQPSDEAGPAPSSSEPRSASVNAERANELARLQQLGYAGYVDETADASRPAGAVIHDRDAIAPGVNLVSVFRLCTARLLDNDGHVLHEWHTPGRSWGHVELLSDGSILAPLAESGDKGSSFVRIDWNGNVLWRLPLAAHHDAELLPDGRIALLTFEYREDLPAIAGQAKLRDDFLVLLTPAGEVDERWSLTELLAGDENWSFEPVEPGPTFLDLLHTNSLVWMRPEHAALGPLFAEGNVLISMRHQNRIAMLRPSEGRVVWSWGREELLGQHDATVLEDGRILLFDNGLGRGWSRGLEVDPATNEIVWEWKAGDPEDFYTMARGAAQRLPGGNTLLVDSDHGRVIEVTRVGRIVWEYYQPGEDDRIATIVRMKRYPLEYLSADLRAEFAR